MANYDIPDPEYKEMSEGWWEALLAEDESIPNFTDGRKTRKTDLALRPDQDNNDWDYVKGLLQDENVITGTVVDYNRGGLLVCGEKFQGFVPVSHLEDLSTLSEEKGREERLTEYVGNQIRLKVIECDQGRGRIVLSERAAQTEPGQRQHLLDTLEMGDVIKGKVTNITDFGVFVDLGGVEGLIHISELSWGRVMDPNDYLNLSDLIDVLVLQVNREKCRVSLSVKQQQPNPWKEVCSRYPTGTVLHGIITQIVKYGAFTRLDTGLEGLIHISEMGLNRNVSPWDVVEEGQEVDVEVVLVDSERQRMSLRLVKKDLCNE